MSQYSIEARSLDIAVVISHNFWVLRGPHGRTLAELHGLATDRRTGASVPIGTDEARHALRIWHLVHQPVFAAALGVAVTDRTFIRLGQARVAAFEGSREEALARWSAAVDAIGALNALDLDYPSYGISIAGPTVNSNAAYRTLGEIMGLDVPTFAGLFEPGVDNHMLPASRIAALRVRDYGPTRSTPAQRAQRALEHSEVDARLHRQVTAAVNRLEAGQGRLPDAGSERMAAALTVLARMRGLTRVDHVVFGSDPAHGGETAMLVEGRLDDPMHLSAQMSARLARDTPLLESVRALEYQVMHAAAPVGTEVDGPACITTGGEPTSA